MNPLASFALTLAPELAGALFGPAAEDTAQAVAGAVQHATGTPDPVAAQQVVARDPQVASALRVELARLAAAAAQTVHTEDLRALADGLAAAAAPAPADPAASSNRMPWAAPLISSLVLLTFGVVVWAALTRTLPAGSETVVTMLLGTLAAMATSVVSYWVGSSAGSAIKTELLFRSQPQAVVSSAGRGAAAPKLS